MQPVERAEYEGVDYAWVMQTTFVVTILVGAPVAALLSTLVALESWGARAAFAVRVGAPIWFVTAIAVALYAKRADAGDGGTGEDGEKTDEDDGLNGDHNGGDDGIDGDDDESPPTETTVETADDWPTEATDEAEKNG